MVECISSPGIPCAWHFGRWAPDIWQQNIAQITDDHTQPSTACSRLDRKGISALCFWKGVTLRQGKCNNCYFIWKNVPNTKQAPHTDSYRYTTATMMHLPVSGLKKICAFSAGLWQMYANVRCQKLGRRSLTTKKSQITSPLSPQGKACSRCQPFLRFTASHVLQRAPRVESFPHFPR